MRVYRDALHAVAALLLLPAMAGAQWRLTTAVGAYVPGNEIGRISSAGGAFESATLEQRPGFAVGATANRWFGDRAGIELAASFVASDVKGKLFLNNVPQGSGAPLAGGSASAWLVPASARLLYRLTRGASANTLYLGAGPAVIWSGGDAYRAAGGLRIDRGTDLGLAGMVGARRRLTDLLSLTATADAYLYQVTLRVRDTSAQPATYKADPRFQSDLVLSAGLSFALPTR